LNSDPRAFKKTYNGFVRHISMKPAKRHGYPSKIINPIGFIGFTGFDTF
jgi:hypothetical protein